MMRTLMVGAAALALLSGVAMAQDYSTTTTNSTVVAPEPMPPAPPPENSYSRTTRKRLVTPFGESQSTRSFSKSQAQLPDGSTTTTTVTRSKDRVNGIAPPSPPPNDNE